MPPFSPQNKLQYDTIKALWKFGYFDIGLSTRRNMEEDLEEDEGTPRNRKS
jgi:hypothetical protein